MQLRDKQANSSSTNVKFKQNTILSTAQKVQNNQDKNRDQLI